jgi:hypothetical protein
MKNGLLVFTKITFGAEINTFTAIYMENSNHDKLYFGMNLDLEPKEHPICFQIL